MNTRQCEHCQQPYVPTIHNKQKYCSPLCSKKAYILRQKEKHKQEQLPPLEITSKYRCPKCGGAINHKECFACSLKKAK